MAKGGGKGAAAKAAKAAHDEESKAKQATAAEAAEASKWDKGSKEKGRKEDKAEKAAKAAAAKAERDRLLDEENASLKTKPAAPSKPAGGKKATSAAKSGPTALNPVPTYSASNLDDALDALDLVNEKTDKASAGARAAKGVETHPERRFKAAFEAYKESELPNARKEHPGLRLQQYHDLLYKQFQKHPDNPFNQVTAAYDATKTDKLAVMATKRDEAESRLRTT